MTNALIDKVSGVGLGSLVVCRVCDPRMSSVASSLERQQ